MDSLQETLFLATLILFLASILGPLVWRRRKLPFPPGPRGLPFIGNMLMKDQLTHRGLAKLSKQYGGLVHLRLGVLHNVAVLTPEMAREVLQVHDHAFSNRHATVAVRYLTYDRSDMAFAPYGPFWRQMRKLCVTKLFSPNRAESWAAVQDEVQSLVRAVQAGALGPVNIGELVFSLTRNITYQAAFGSISNEGQDDFMSICQEFSKLMGSFNIVDFLPGWLQWFDLQGFNKRLERARGSLDRFIDNIINEHMAAAKEGKKPEDSDLVDDLIAFLGDETAGKVDELETSLRLNKDNIKGVVMDVMFGGTDTVAAVIEWAMAELMKHPAELKKVQDELAEVVGLDRKVHRSDLDKLTYLRCCIKEALRLHPPIPVILHETTEDVEVSGYFIPAGARISINAWAIGRNPAAWEDAESFKPSRFAGKDAADLKGNFFELIPFGGGRRSCPGMQLGLYTLELAVAQMLHCFTWALPDGMKPSDLDMSDVFGLTVPRAHRLVAVPTPRLVCPLF